MAKVLTHIMRKNNEQCTNNNGVDYINLVPWLFSKWAALNHMPFLLGNTVNAWLYIARAVSNASLLMLCECRPRCSVRLFE